MKKSWIRRATRLVGVATFAGGLIWAGTAGASAQTPGRQGAASNEGASVSALAKLPYELAGLNSRQAAAHLLNRLAFGARPGEVDELVKSGLERWVDEQLRGDLPDPELEQRLQAFPALSLGAREVRQRYVYYGNLLEEAARVGMRRPENPSDEQQRDFNREVREYQLAHGVLLVDDLFDELRGQKVIRAVYGRNQLKEALVDFWFNHFNVAAIDGNIRHYALDYELQCLRPNVLGSFGSMVRATAHHPAMLYYLNNAQSSSAPGVATTLEVRLAALMPEERESLRKGQPGKRKNGGLNENYARELLELHTLGVDGGYTQKDVTEVARSLTGWTVFPRESTNQNLRNMVDGKERLGYVYEGDFLFRSDQHDAAPKFILGQKFPPGRGIDEGEEVLRLVVAHPSTARYVCRKLAQRFVADEPSPALVERMAERFQSSQGNISEVMRVLIYSQEFWGSQGAGKLKSPFELACSSFRACGAEVTPNRNQYDWLTRLGEPLYGCIPPTGYSERSQVWLTPGHLVNRINFAQSLIQNRVGGVRVDLDKLAKISGSRENIVTAMVANLLPGAQQSDAQLQEVSALLQEDRDGMPGVPLWFEPKTPGDLKARRDYAWRQRLAGAILGCPEFQRK